MLLLLLSTNANFAGLTRLVNKSIYESALIIMPALMLSVLSLIKIMKLADTK